MLAYENADKHMDLISSCDCRFLHLSCCDEEIYSKFREAFPDMPLDMIDEEAMRSAPMKERWRKFGELFKRKIPDYNFGTLLRCNVEGEYDSPNTILGKSLVILIYQFAIGEILIVPKIQFLAIEIARNREGFNGRIRG
ncbi:Polysacc synt 4 domain containing protein [Trichuris trichiura]|uniref:Polysacc synt 4 domain containing protein n=1 Tax=Trichuris trichiura TaxID=36087 RepID=A0A077ZCV2_TRITR|nr:Polysacc synt 4 domain containing protein [Trichuris trichiura]